MGSHNNGELHRMPHRNMDGFCFVFDNADKMGKNTFTYKCVATEGGGSWGV
jgi:hypothetical protein